MEISTQTLDHIELIALKGRVDSMEAVHLQEALAAARRRGMRWLVIDMSQLDYMSSAGFRALAGAQRDNQNHHGDVILTQVSPLIHEALELVGFTDHFKIIDPRSAAIEYAEHSSAGMSGAEDRPAASEA